MWIFRQLVVRKEKFSKNFCTGMWFKDNNADFFFPFVTIENSWNFVRPGVIYANSVLKITEPSRLNIKLTRFESTTVQLRHQKHSIFLLVYKGTEFQRAILTYQSKAWVISFDCFICISIMQSLSSVAPTLISSRQKT